MIETRRDFLRGAGLALGAGLASTPAWAQSLTQGRRLAVSETFVFPEWTAAMATVAADGGHDADAAFWRAFSGRAGGFGPSALGEGELTLLSLAAPGVEPFEDDRAAALASLANDRLAEQVRRSGGRAAGLATVAAFDPRAADEAERALSRLGMAGLSLGANRGLRLDHRRLWPVYEVAVAAKAPIYLPAGYAAADGDAAYRAAGSAGVISGAAQDSAAHATQLIFGGVLDAFPSLQVVLARLGEGAPFWHDHLRGVGETRCKGRAVDDYFRDNIHLTTADMESASTLAYCRDLFGEGRLLTSRDNRPAYLAGLSQDRVDLRRLTKVQAERLLG